MTSDIEIAQAATPRPIAQIADELKIPETALEPYGRIKGKVNLNWLLKQPIRDSARMILVTAISPTPAGEGKTTTTVGLGDALKHIGKDVAICLREPSLGPVFGMKGGAAGGGYAQVIPMEDINLHFNGDLHAIGVANNLLAALLDNHIHHGNVLDIDVRRVTWKRVLDMNDRALRDITVSLGGPGNGYPRQDGFDIVVASEIMAIFCLATDLDDLKPPFNSSWDFCVHPHVGWYCSSVRYSCLPPLFGRRLHRDWTSTSSWNPAVPLGKAGSLQRRGTVQI